MKTARKNAKEPVRYDLPLIDPEDPENAKKSALVPISEYVGGKKTLSLAFTGRIFCIRCGRNTKKSFAQGYCFPCFQSAPEVSECVLRPELCRAQDGESRDMDWSKKHCLVDHIVYLAVSSDVKVGVTRKSQVPTRWIDQGAHLAMPLAETPNRYTAGLIEVALKRHLTDRTDWRKMLKDERAEGVDLVDMRARLVKELPKDLQQFAVDAKRSTAIIFPVKEFPVKVKSVGFDKIPEISGRLLGIKGQYLIFDENRVINMRKHQGYEVSVSY